MKIYDTVIIGAGAAGLYCGCKLTSRPGKETLILEKGKKPGLKLLMAGGGQCNVTHGGSIKDFLNCYGDNGKLIRSALQRHSNLELCGFLESLGVSLYEREDGKIFPRSLDGREVLKALLSKVSENNIEIKSEVEVKDVRINQEGEEGGEGQSFTVFSAGGGEFRCRNLVIAAGGCSYPSTGSDGKMLGILRDNLGVKVKAPSPALTSVIPEDYRYGGLRGISFDDVEISLIPAEERRKPRKLRGDLLFAAQTLSGPAILNGSRYMRPGDELRVNYVHPTAGPEVIARCRAEFPGNGKSPQVYMSDCLGLPKRFAQVLSKRLNMENRKVSQLSGKEIKALAETITEDRFKIKKLSGYNEAMVTAGGVSLDEMDLRRMCLKKHEGLYIIGEILDVDGDTGGYNLQFAYSSACTAAEDINGR